ncbi:hypothetical protein AD940_14320 [Gluconobacter thailandicus]|uniref:tail fiber domain-containing protein n=1 Tax=Gluconobacter thailandicus TaxID=257438 RepID=UPI000777711F|nr:tail fiber domain-containing protein [Gluconobacter thailandicus]KXV33113.1 hypothetical protein AD940_14320 [Gluconobacter thailandicus]
MPGIGNPWFETMRGSVTEATATYISPAANIPVSPTMGSIGLNAETALLKSSAAVETAQEAKNAIIQFGDKFLPLSAIGQPSGVVGFDAGGGATIPALVGGYAYLTLGVASSTPMSHLQMSTGNGSANLIAWGDAAGSYLAVDAAALHPNTNGATSLGTAGNAWSAIVSQTALQVISDLNDKVLVGTIGDSAYTDTTTKLRAVWADIQGIVYTLKDGQSGRQHVGVIAQYVEAAFTKQGLNADDFGVWCSTPKTQVVTQVIDGKNVTTVEPVYEADGKTQATQQTVRYEELLCLGLFCERIERAESLAALTARVTALEAKAAA